MGGQQSHERKAEEEREEKEREEKEREEEEAGKHLDNTEGPGPAAPEDTPGELPQCQMGNRKVDNMCFMISCTNWY